MVVPEGKIHTNIILLMIFLLLYFNPLILSGILERTFYMLVHSITKNSKDKSRPSSSRRDVCLSNEKHISSTLNQQRKQRHENIFLLSLQTLLYSRLSTKTTQLNPKEVSVELNPQSVCTRLNLGKFTVWNSPPPPSFFFLA